MENSVMSLQWKLTFQKASLRNLILISIGISIVMVLIGFSGYSCGIQHMIILNEITSYEKSLEPEFCEIIVEKINFFNDDCEPQIEILDCG
jgi:hypothetical protein